MEFNEKEWADFDFEQTALVGAHAKKGRADLVEKLRTHHGLLVKGMCWAPAKPEEGKICMEVRVQPQGNLATPHATERPEAKTFTLNAAVDSLKSQQELYAIVGDSRVKKVVQGDNACIIAYGQTVRPSFAIEPYSLCSNCLHARLTSDRGLSSFAGLGEDILHVRSGERAQEFLEVGRSGSWGGPACSDAALPAA